MRNLVENHQFKSHTSVKASNAKTKTLVMRMEIGNANLTHEIKRVFDMAKSSGQELDLTFSFKAARTA